MYSVIAVVRMSSSWRCGLPPCAKWKLGAERKTFSEILRGGMLQVSTFRIIRACVTALRKSYVLSGVEMMLWLMEWRALWSMVLLLAWQALLLYE